MSPKEGKHVLLLTKHACSEKQSDLVHGSSRGNHLHDVSSASIGPNRQPPSNDLPEGCQVWGDAKVLLGTASGYPEACHDFIKAQQGAIFFADCLKTLHGAWLSHETVAGMILVLCM